MVNRSHAVVIGASMAGLFAACALSERYEKVTVYDRDTLPDGPEARKGVPQGKQAHALLGRGVDAMTELLPGFDDDMAAAGAAVFDAQGDSNFYLDGYLLKPEHTGLMAMAMTRPAIEHLARQRVAALDGVEIIGGADVTGLLTSDGRATGVSVQRGDDGAEEVAADLVVDAAGRGSRGVTWLEELGYPVPAETQVRAGVVYVSQLFKADPQGGRMATVTTAYPGHHRSGGVLQQEGDTVVVLLTGMVGEDPPIDEKGMLEYAESLEIPDVADFIRESEPLGEPVKMRYPVSRRRHFEKLDRYLGGYIVTGDALCSFNPVYGQGITVAALEALEIRSLLAASDDDTDLSRRFFRETAKVTAMAWMMSAAADLRYPQAEGKRLPMDWVFHSYMDLYRAAATIDPGLGKAFIRVMYMLDSPARLLSPSLALRVFRQARKGRANRVLP